MLSPLETRPWIQAAWLFGVGWLAWKTGGVAGAVLGAAVLALLPATVALLGFGERALQTVNPVAWYRVVRGLGPFYLLLLAALGIIGAVSALLARVQWWSLIEITVALWLEVSFFALVGACLYVRRKPLGYVPSRSPERAAARADAEHFKRRARMIDEIFQKVRIGRHVDATQPLALWLKDPDNDAEHVTQDAFFIVEQVMRWENPAALNPIGSTLIRHLLRYGRADAALSVFQMLRERSAHFTMDSAHDLRTLADYAEGCGREELAQSMRLETPVFHPPR
jgi:pentatricopeptide repeat protein